MQKQMLLLKKWLLSWKTHSSLLTGILVAVAGAWFAHWMGPGSPQQPVNPQVRRTIAEDDQAITMPAPSAEEIAAQMVAESRISFADWQQLVKAVLPEDKRKKIFENYRGEQVRWRGVVNQVNRVPEQYGGSANKRFALVLYEDQDVRDSQQLGRAPAICMFPDSESEELDQVVAGQKVVVQGTLAAPETLHGTLLGTRLYNCKLLLR